MGCAGSKLEDQEAVALCRERTLLLADAIRHRYALADAHAAYSRSLRSVGAALHAFLHGGHAVPPGSPVLPLPAHRKGDPLPPSPPPAAIPASSSAGAGVHHSRTHSGSSHIQFQSSGEDSDEDGHFHLHSDGSSPVHLHPDDAPGPTFFNANYARNHPTTPSISFEQQPQSPEAVRFGSSEPPPSAYPYPYPYDGSTYPPQNPSFYTYPYPDPYPSYGGMGGFFGSSSPPPNIPQPPTEVSMASPSSSKTPPPPPSPPRTSAWDFVARPSQGRVLVMVVQ